MRVVGSLVGMGLLICNFSFGQIIGHNEHSKEEFLLKYDSLIQDFNEFDFTSISTDYAIFIFTQDINIHNIESTMAAVVLPTGNSLEYSTLHRSTSYRATFYEIKLDKSYSYKLSKSDKRSLEKIEGINGFYTQFVTINSKEWYPISDVQFMVIYRKGEIVSGFMKFGSIMLNNDNLELDSRYRKIHKIISDWESRYF